MPTYDYECRECGQTFEHFQRISEPVKTTCPSCGRETLERLIGAGAGFIFKGSGFYSTDYRSSDYKSKAKADSGSSSASGSSSGSSGSSGASSSGSGSSAPSTSTPKPEAAKT